MSLRPIKVGKGRKTERRRICLGIGYLHSRPDGAGANNPLQSSLGNLLRPGRKFSGPTAARSAQSEQEALKRRTKKDLYVCAISLNNRRKNKGPKYQSSTVRGECRGERTLNIESTSTTRTEKG